VNSTHSRLAGLPRIAIVGSGPSGCYTAQFLRKKWPDAEIVIYDRLETPFGLIRYGVAPDHLGTKAIAKQFERLFTRDGVTFAGGVEVGTDLAVDELRRQFDVVVLATGLWGDRTIDGFHDAQGRPSLPGVYGSGRLTRMINAHPSRDSSDVRIGRRTVIVGAGNVAIDLVRLLLTSSSQLVEVGVPGDVIRALTDGPVERVDVVSRSVAGRAKFDVAMIRELAKVPDVRFRSDADAFPVKDAEESVRAQAVAELVAGSPRGAARQVSFWFGWTPAHLDGAGRVERAVFRDTADVRGTLTLEADSVCTAVGFTQAADDALLRRAFEGERTDLDHGRLADGVYCVGWLRRGPVGTIPANRADARLVADAIIADYEFASRPAIPSSLP
jgi:ferredoxin--NADP+ reductase